MGFSGVSPKMGILGNLGILGFWGKWPFLGFLGKVGFWAFWESAQNWPWTKNGDLVKIRFSRKMGILGKVVKWGNLGFGGNWVISGRGGNDRYMKICQKWCFFDNMSERCKRYEEKDIYCFCRYENEGSTVFRWKTVVKGEEMRRKMRGGEIIKGI